MTPFVWTEEMSVGDPEMDAQHRQIIDLINGFDDRMEPKVAFDAIMNMFRYAGTHFEAEEALLQRVGYPQALLAAQRLAHQEFLSKASEFAGQQLDDYTLHIRVAAYLTRWLMSHILSEDMKYKPFVQGAAPLPHA